MGDFPQVEACNWFVENIPETQMGDSFKVRVQTMQCLVEIITELQTGHVLQVDRSWQVGFYGKVPHVLEVEIERLVKVDAKCQTVDVVQIDPGQRLVELLSQYQTFDVFRVQAIQGLVEKETQVEVPDVFEVQVVHGSIEMVSAVIQS